MQSIPIYKVIKIFLKDYYLSNSIITILWNSIHKLHVLNQKKINFRLINLKTKETKKSQKSNALTRNQALQHLQRQNALRSK
jgi:hypothetical protein